MSSKTETQILIDRERDGENRENQLGTTPARVPLPL